MDSNHRPRSYQDREEPVNTTTLAVHEELRGWLGNLAIEETGPSLKPKYSFCIVTEEQSLHVVAEFKGIKVF